MNTALGFLDAAVTALWLGGLWFAAPLLPFEDDTPATRLRNALILGMCIVAGLGLLGVLYPASLALALAGCCVAAYRRSPCRTQFSTPYVVIALLVLWVAWPALVRPLTEGDSLSYHLPNASAWLHVHSVWTTTTRYWWYPPGSELFAAGLLVVGGTYSLGVSGFVAVLLLGWRLTTLAATGGSSRWASFAIVGAVVTAYPIALQAGNLENDVWLGAFFLEGLVALRAGRRQFVATVAALSLIKPFGFLYAGVPAGFRLRDGVIALLPLATWGVRDAILAKNALLPIANTAYPHVERTTIAAHLLSGGAQVLLDAVIADGPMTIVLSLAGVGMCFVRGQRSLSIAALVSLLLFLWSPFGYDNPLPQLATGHALRYAMPLFCIGALGLLAVVPRIPAAYVTMFAVAAIAYNVDRIEAIFWSDAATHGATFVVFLAALIALVVRLAQRVVPIGLASALACAGFLISANQHARVHPLGYFDDILARDGTPTRFYDWIATARPSAVVAIGVSLGAIEIASPTTVGIDGLDGRACCIARREGAIVVLAAPVEPSPECGRLLYRDRSVVAFDAGTTETTPALR